MAACDFTHGAQFNRLTVTGPIFKDQTNKHWYAPVRCDCGTEKRVMCANLVAGKAISCGCATKERKAAQGNYTHGAYGTPAYRSYWAMLMRCHNPKVPAYKNYSARGIQVCDQWRSGFEAFVADMGPRPDGCSLDRIDPNGNYEPSNCRWATVEQQSNNKRDSVFLEHLGKRMTISQWAAEVHLPDCVIRTRLGLGWSVSDALTKPSSPGSNQYGGGKLVEFGGQSMTWHEWAKHLNISYYTLKKRMENEWTLERTLTQTLEVHRRK